MSKRISVKLCPNLRPRVRLGMSRFFATGDTDTESSSESSDEEPRLGGGMCRYDELKSVIHAMKNSQKIKDIAKLQTGKQYVYMLFTLYTASPLMYANTLVLRARPLYIRREGLGTPEQFLCKRWNSIYHVVMCNNSVP